MPRQSLLANCSAGNFAATELDVDMQADLKRREQIAAGRARPGRQQGAAAECSAVAQIPPCVAATLGPPLGLPRTSAVQVCNNPLSTVVILSSVLLQPERRNRAKTPTQATG